MDHIESTFHSACQVRLVHIVENVAYKKKGKWRDTFFLPIIATYLYFIIDVGNVLYFQNCYGKTNVSMLLLWIINYKYVAIYVKKNVNVLLLSLKRCKYVASM